MIAIALLIAVQAVSGGEPSGPFVIETKSIREEGIDFPFDYKITTLTWNAPSGLATYELRDTGEEVRARYALGAEPRNCFGVSDLRGLARPSRGKFSFKDVLVGCRSVLSAEQADILSAEVVEARRDFAKAYDVFFRRTTEEHGLSLQRCRKYRRGDHGPICAGYWDKGLKVRVQGKGKRS